MLHGEYSHLVEPLLQRRLVRIAVPDGVEIRLVVGAVGDLRSPIVKSIAQHMFLIGLDAAT